MPGKDTPQCPVCESRRGRRFCPALQATICTICCGTSRENTIDCPLDCPHLEQAHSHERLPERDPREIPSPDVQLPRDFVDRNAELLNFVSHSILRHALEGPLLTDNDVRDALDAMVQTYRTLQSGLYYQSRPSNLYAARLQQQIQKDLDEFINRQRSSVGFSNIRDADVLGVLVTLQRLVFYHHNGRPRCRAFLAHLHRTFSGRPATSRPAGPGLIVQS